MAEKEESEENSYEIKNPGNESAPVTKSRKFLGFLFILGLLLIAAFALIVWKFNFIIKDELVLRIEPSSISLDSTNKDVNHVFFKVVVQRFIGCEAECSYRFRDFSQNITISDEKIILTSDSFEKEYVISLNKSGEGQAIYLFEVECRNKKSFSCSTEGAKREKSAIVSINYHLTSEEAGIKEMIYSEMDALDANISSSISRMGRLRSEYFLIAKNYLPNLSEEMLSLSGILDSSGSIEKSIENDKRAIENAWKEGDYSSSGKIFSERLMNSAELLFAKADSGENSLNSTFSMYNSLYERMNMLISKQKSTLPEIYNYSKLLEDSQLLSESSAISSSISEIAGLLKWRNYKSLKNLSLSAESISSRLSLLENSYEKRIEASFAESSSELYAAELYAREIDSDIPSSALNISEIALKNSSYPELELSCAGMLFFSEAVNSHNVKALLALSSSPFENSSKLKEASDILRKNAFSMSASSVLIELQNVPNVASYSRISLINNSLYHLR
ncbi:MAG: hypothetical protein NTV63_03700, partial [Candidatus Woesearchaeota archaeon]|nr:hypothetical protein [Candidatus Woesearchaeota archaeon]